MKTRKPARSLSFTVLSAGLLASASALAGYPGSYDTADYDLAQVLSAEPVSHPVRIVATERQCRPEARYVAVDSRHAAPADPAPMLVGGIIGAVIGHQIGHRESRGVGTVAGALIGGAIGQQLMQDHGNDHDRGNGYGYGYGYGDRRELRAIYTEHCEMRPVDRFEQRLDGYQVTYRYRGHIYSTRLPQDPGATLRVRVNVQPVG